MKYRIGSTVWVINCNFHKEKEIFTSLLVSVISYIASINSYHVYSQTKNSTSLSDETKLFDFRMDADIICKKLNETVKKRKSKTKEKVKHCKRNLFTS